MNLKTFALMTLALALFVAIPAQLDAADAMAGKTSFLAKCKTCHAADGAGNAGMAKVLKVEIKHLGDPTVQAKSDDDLKAVITGGQGKMKAISGLDGAAVDNIVAHIRTIKK